MNIFLNAAAPAGGFDFTLILLMMGIFLVVQFVIVGPKQKKKEKEKLDYINNMEQGTQIIMNSGIYGKFLRKDNNALVIEVDTGVKLKVDPSAINYDLTKGLNKSAE